MKSKDKFLVKDKVAWMQKLATPSNQIKVPCKIKKVDIQGNQVDSTWEELFSYGFGLPKNRQSFTIYEFNDKLLRPITYTPDFVFKDGYGVDYWIEVKGWSKSHDLWAIRRKFVEDYCQACDIRFYEVRLEKNYMTISGNWQYRVTQRTWKDLTTVLGLKERKDTISALDGRDQSMNYIIKKLLRTPKKERGKNGRK